MAGVALLYLKCSRKKSQTEKGVFSFCKKDAFDEIFLYTVYRCFRKNRGGKELLMKELPKEFLKRMQEMLPGEYEDFLQSYEAPRPNGLRVNTGKISCEEFEKIAPFPIQRIPWTKNGYFYPAGEHPARHPYYRAGLYYLQEPSAMAPAAHLPIVPGERVLDLCAAPGGKATELGVKLAGEGLLVANDISTSRARALLRNLELFGIGNVLVTSETPARLAKVFPEYFHKILLDAPCSGEGMFRKDLEAVKAWYPERPKDCAAVQKELLRLAVSMLRPGGLLLYSTCTFAPSENEGIIAAALREFSELALIELPASPGFAKGVPAWGDKNPAMEKCVRLWPHRLAGEGHFMALLKKQWQSAKEEAVGKSRPARPIDGRLEEFFKGCQKSFSIDRIESKGGKVWLLPSGLPKVSGLHILRGGLYLGELKKDRFEPAQPLAMALSAGEYPVTVRFSPRDERLPRYFHGEELPLLEEESQGKKGWALVCAGDFPVGWGKIVRQTLKNKYPAGWRQS